MSTKLDRDPDGRDVQAQGHVGNGSSSDELIDSVRALVERYCRARLGGLPGGPEAADAVAGEICLAAAHALRQREDRGAPFAALVFSIAAHHVTEAQRRLERSSSGAGQEPTGETGTASASGV